MTAYTVFVLSAIIGWIGFFGFSFENISGRMTRYTRWSEMTNRQWACVYAMTQFIAALVVGALYMAFKDFS